MDKRRLNIPFGDLKRRYQSIKTEIDEAVARVLDSGWYILGKELEAFEQAFADYTSSSCAVGVGSGTEALHLALVASGVQAGDEVITVSNTAVPTISAISFAQATPVFVDINPDTYCMDAAHIEGAVSPKTKAIVPVHLFGHPCDMPAIIESAQKYNLKVIEDCAQAHGARIDNKPVGTFGDYGCFSFYPSKNLGAFGDAGMVTTQNPGNAEKIRLLRNYGQSKRYYHDIKGFNSRLDELQAAILHTQLKHLESWTQRRQEIARLYADHLKESSFKLPAVAEHSEHVFHLYVIRYPRRDILRDYLLDNGIGTQIHYPVPCHLQQAYRENYIDRAGLEVTERYANEIVSLPNYPELRDEEIVYVCDILNQFEKRQ